MENTVNRPFRTTHTAETWATILAWRGLSESLQDIAEINQDNKLTARLISSSGSANPIG
jgi:hypothetical protein